MKFIHFSFNDLKKQRLTKMLEIFKEYDIVCIQEVWDCLWGSIEYFYENCRKEGWYVAYTKIDVLTSTGNIILSKKPIKKTGWMVFKNSGDWQRIMANGILYALIDDMYIFTTHLHSDSFPKILTCQKIREKQMMEVYDYIHKIKTTDSKWLLCGDLNICVQSELYKKVIKMFGMESTLKLCGYPNTYNHLSFLVPWGWQNVEKFLCIDHIFTNMKIEKCKVLSNIDISDHFPIMLRIKD